MVLRQEMEVYNMENIIKEMVEKAIYYKETIGSIDEAFELIRFVRDLIDKFAETINCPSNWRSIGEELAEEYKGRNIIDGDYCWQNCSATEHCKECNRLCNGSIDYYENYDFMAEEPQWKQAMMNTFLARK